MPVSDSFRPCAHRFILQKFKRQMGILTNAFETERKEGENGRHNKILVVVNANAAAEAMVRMLEVYYARDREDKYMQSHRPHITIIDTVSPTESRLQDWRPQGMEYIGNVEDDKSNGRIGLEFRNGRILKSPVGDDGTMRDAVANFVPDSRGEATSILWSKIVSSHATRGEYDVVLYPDTATRIASKVLALTSQGRGFTIPWQCGTLVKMPNGPSNPFVSFLNLGAYVARPMKDLSDTEVTAYLNITHNRPLTSEQIPATVESDSTTVSIDSLMVNYISGLETSFPSIVATTGRTADKLDFPTVVEDKPACLVCSMPKQADNVKTWLDNITVKEPAAEMDSVEAPVVERAGLEDVTDLVCYGCYTLFRSSREVVRWPL